VKCDYKQHSFFLREKESGKHILIYRNMHLLARDSDKFWKDSDINQCVYE